MSQIKLFIKDRVEAMAFHEYLTNNQNRVSVALDKSEVWRLDYLAKVLEDSRAALASELLKSAIIEAEKELKLNPFDFESEYGKLFKAYLENAKNEGKEDN